MTINNVNFLRIVKYYLIFENFEQLHFSCFNQLYKLNPLINQYYYNQKFEFTRFKVSFVTKFANEFKRTAKRID